MSKMRWVALAWFLALGSIGVDGSDARAGAQPCKLATKGDSIVGKACVGTEGGFKAAKALMKKMRLVVNKAGKEQFECTTCHDKADDERYDTLTKDGKERFKTFVAVYEKAK
jgi:hypothetical protein